MIKIWITVSIGAPRDGSIVSQTDITLSDSKEWAEGKALANFRNNFGCMPQSVATSAVLDEFVAAAYADIAAIDKKD